MMMLHRWFRTTVFLLILMMVTAFSSSATTAEDYYSSSSTNHKKYILMGLPKSGSYLIHSFIHCMNTDKNQQQQQHASSTSTSSTMTRRTEEEEEVISEDTTTAAATTTTTVTTSLLSSAHYCCKDPHYHHRTDTLAASSSSIFEESDTLASTSFFPCPSHMIPCGTCLQQYYYNYKHDISSTRFNHWMEYCGNYNVYTNFHVEATSRSIHNNDDEEEEQEYNFFLPQHYTLPYLIHADPVLRKIRESSEQDETTTTSSSSPTPTVWILNHRSSSELWATHVSHWYSITQRILNSFQIPYYYYSTTSENDNNDKEMTLDDLQHELDTTSFERLHNYTDHQRRIIELMAIYDYHIHKIEQFVHDYSNNDNNNNTAPIELYDIDIDDVEQTPMRLAQALGYVVKEDDNNDVDTTIIIKQVIQQCYTSTYETYVSQFDDDYTDFQLTTTFRASA